MAGEFSGLRFDVTCKFSVAETISSLVTLQWGGGWSATHWSVWAITTDGRRFFLRRFLDEGTARYTATAYEGQLAESTPREWAQSKGFNELVTHLEELAPPA